MSDPPPVSLVMITWNRREAALSAARRALDSHPTTPLIVVDNGSSDGTADALAQLSPSICVIRSERNLGSAGRTLGVRAARTPYVAFLDDDSAWPPGALTDAARIMDRWPDVAVIAARTSVQSAAGEPVEDPLNHLLAESPLPPHAASGLPTALGFLACGAVVRARPYLAAGGFHPRFGVGGEESLLAIDLAVRGCAVVYAAEVRAVHEPDSGAPRPGRVARQIRNDLWTTWLRRPAPVVAAQTARTARRGIRQAAARRGLAQAAAGLGWVLRERRRVPAEIEGQLRMLDRPE